MDPLTIALATGAIGAFAGSQASKQKQTMQRVLAPESELEKQAGGVVGSQLGSLQGLINQGPGQSDVTAGLDSQRGLAALLQQLSQTGGMPGQQDFQQAQQFTNQAFAPQQLAMQQGFQEEDLELQKLAARLGRSPNDPVLRQKLAQSRGMQQQQLGAAQTSFMSQFAQQMPQQRLSYANQLSQVQGGLASQALANRQALLQMGQSIKSGEQNFRLGTATQINSGSSGGGLGGGLSGALAGFGVGAGVANNLSGLFGGSGAGGAAAPMASAGMGKVGLGNGIQA